MNALVLAMLAQIAVEPVRPPTPDATGAYTVELGITDMPVAVAANGSFDQTYTWDLPPDTRVRRVRTFVAVDRLNVLEAHALVLADDFQLAARGPHKETTSSYDAWAIEDSDYVTGPAGALLNFHAHCHPTAGKAIKCHFGIILELAPVYPPVRAARQRPR